MLLIVVYLGGNGPTLTPTHARIYFTRQISPQKLETRVTIDFFLLKKYLKTKIISSKINNL